MRPPEAERRFLQKQFNRPFQPTVRSKYFHKNSLSGSKKIVSVFYVSKMPVRSIAYSDKGIVLYDSFADESLGGKICPNFVRRI